MRLQNFCFLCLFVANSSVAATKQMSPQQQQDFVSAIQKKVAQTKTLKMGLTQTRVLKVFEDKLIANGKLLFKFPDAIRWQIDSPYKSAIIYNNKNVAKFDFKDGAWQKLNFAANDLMRQIMGNISNWTKGDFKSAESDYQIRYFIGPKIVLTPRSKILRQNLSAIELTFDQKENIIESVRILEPRGDYVQIDFRLIAENTKLVAKVFDLEKPGDIP